MAEGIVLNIAKNILDQLSPLAGQTIGELWGIKAELEKLQTTVSTIQGVLLHAEEQYHQSPQVKEWVAQLKDALYDAEDLLGEFYVESQLKDLRNQNKIMKEVSTFFSSSNQLVSRFKMVRKLKEVRMKIDTIKENQGLHLDEGLVGRKEEVTTQREESEHLFIPTSLIIGREKETKEVKTLLLQDFDKKENVSVVSIVGIGGLGKTAFAKYVFNDEDVEKHFELRKWVTVSDDFNINKIVGKIIASAKDAERPEHLDMESRLSKEVDGKRYLLVLDDLWNDNRGKWLDLKCLLDRGARGSKILITTRSSIVAETSGDFAPYVLRGLASEESLDLFMRHASSEGQNIPDEEKFSIGKEIIKKCHGVPLALRVIGGMLYSKKNRADWLYFKDNELQQIPQGETSINAVLRKSYDHLPSHLKQCFAYCSLFPKDFEIQKSELTSLWVAQGFIQPSPRGDLDLEQKAHYSFMHLLHRGFFQDRNDDALGNVMTCKMHDLMHDLACQVAGTECDVIGPDRRGSLHHKTLRHLSIPSNEFLLDEFPKLQFGNMKLRTFLLIDHEWWSNTLPKLTCHKLMSSLKYVRALTLCNTDMVVVPSCLCKLELLSHLDLSHNKKLERLPRSIKSLQNLMTLILTYCDSLKELPSDIEKLVKLTNLYLPISIERMPQSLGKLTSLRRLTYFIVREDSSKTRNCAMLSELGGLNNLRTELTIKMVGYIKNAVVESNGANLKGKQFLDSLGLHWGHTLEGNRQDEAEVRRSHEALLKGLQPHANLRMLKISGYDGTIFPRWMMEDITLCLPNLIEVIISNCKKCRYLPPLGRLPHLKRLALWNLDEVESIGIFIGESSSSNSAAPSPPFPILLELSIESCPKLKSMPSIIENVERLNLTNVSAELVKQSFHLPRLRHLEIWKIEYLEILPDWVQHCTALETLEISFCGDLASLLENLTQLKSLEELTIGGCLKLKSMPSIIENVEMLGLTDVSAEIVKQPFRLPRLRWLRIHRIEYLEGLLEWIQHCTALETLQIVESKDLASLPESMTQLKSLQTLMIWNCSELLRERCKREIGEDWHKIRQIPTITIRYEHGIQECGC